MNFSSDELVKDGFAGFVEWNALVWDEVPPGPGVYVVLHDGTEAPTILHRNPAGRFKERDPTVSVETLKAAWIEGCPLLYIGKAIRLRTRLRQYRAHGDGKPIGHCWGGRYIWQLNGSSELRVAWKVTGEDPRQLEREMLTSFQERYRQLPFANLRHRDSEHHRDCERAGDHGVPHIAAGASPGLETRNEAGAMIDVCVPASPNAHRPLRVAAGHTRRTAATPGTISPQSLGTDSALGLPVHNWAIRQNEREIQVRLLAAQCAET